MSKIRIAAGATTPEEQLIALGWKRVTVRSSLLLCLLRPLTNGGEPCSVGTAPSGKGDGKVVPFGAANFLAFEVDKDGNAKSGNFGSPRAIDFVESTLTEVPGMPGIWENLEPKTMFVVPDEFKVGNVQVVTREGQEQTPAPGDRLSVDNRGFVNTVTAASVAANYTLL